MLVGTISSRLTRETAVITAVAGNVWWCAPREVLQVKRKYVRVGRVEFPQPEGARFLLSLHCSCSPRCVGAAAILCSVIVWPCMRDTLIL